MAAHSTDQQACRTLLRSGSRSFHAASWLLPPRIKRPAAALYAFCRLADDAVDLSDDPLTSLDALRDRLGAIYRGNPDDHAADRAFALTVAEFAIPRALPEALLDGFHWDAVGRRYETLDELYGYAARVAGSVGAMMALIMGVTAPDAVARATELGIAMQLTNIARDVGEDARAGRLYLPLAWLREAGIDPDHFLAQPSFSPALGRVIERLLDAADTLYRQAETGIAALPRSCRPGIRAARLLYDAIGGAVRCNGCDSISTRAVVPWREKLGVLSRGLIRAPEPAVTGAIGIEAARFLVAAIDPRAAPRRQIWTPLNWVNQIDARIAWLVALFERLEQAERL
jgi:phytoene synthase